MIVFSRSRIHLKWNIQNADETERLKRTVSESGATTLMKIHAEENWIRDTTLYLHSDIQWLRENLLCLISNAVKFSNEADVVLSVDMMIEEVSAVGSSETSKSGKRPQKYIRFGVVDKGLKLTDEELAEFFRFNSMSKSRFTGGIGLGLVTLAKRVDALDGKYGANCRSDGLNGTEVWFAIPYKETKPFSSHEATDHLNLNLTIKKEPNLPPLSPIATEEKIFPSTSLSSPPSNGISANGNSKLVVPRHVLIVDDSAAIIKMLSMMLKKLGYVVSTAMHGKAAVDIIQEEWVREQQIEDMNVGADGEKIMFKEVDIILMDIQMPVMNGLEAMKRIRKVEQIKNASLLSGSQTMHTVTSDDGDEPPLILPKRANLKPLYILAMSANSEFSTYQDAVNAGADAFLNKPFTMELFEQTLEKVQRNISQ